MRTIFRQELREKWKKVLMLFCDNEGEMLKERTIDLNTLGKLMNENGITVGSQISHNMASLFETFGGITYDEKITQI